MNEFKYVTPQSLKETVALISEYKGRARVVAGGTDWLAKMKKGLPMPEVLVNIECVSDLNYIRHTAKSGLRIGAVTPLSAIEKSDVIRNKFPLLTQAVSSMASPFLRNRATIGGNIGNAAPSADTAPALIALGAKVKVVGRDSEKIIPIEEFFTGPGQTALKEGQIISEIQVPDLPPRSAGAYLKHKRREGADLAVVGVAALVSLERDKDNLKDIRLALGAVAPTPIRANKAEEILRGQRVTDELLEKAGKAASDESQPIDDARGSADYRKKLVAILVARAVKQAVDSISAITNG